MPTPIFDYFAENLRGPLFGGFLSAGAFLLSMKTFIVMQIKEKVYDDVFYQSEHKEKSGSQLYKPLSRLSNALFWGVLLCLVAAFAQFSVGLYQCETCAIISLCLAVVAAIALFTCMFLCYLNIRQLYLFSAIKYDRNKSSDLPSPSDDTKTDHTSG